MSINADDLKRQLQGRWHELFQHKLGPEQGFKSGEYVFFCPFHNDRDSDKPNLWVNPEDGKWYCHGQCKDGGDGFELIKRLSGVGFRDALAEVSEVYGFSEPSSQNGQHREPDGVYTYNNSEGQPYIAIGRFPNKQFVAFHFDENGHREKGLNGCDRILYRLDEVKRAVSEKRGVIIVEGEKDVDRLAAEGFVATTNPFGAGKWQHVNDEPLNGAHVVIIPDNDEVGHNHAHEVARSLHGKAASVKVVELPLDGEGADTSDYLDAGHSADDLRALIKSTDEWQPPTDEPEEPREYHCTDLGNAERFADQHGNEARFVPQWGWLTWDGQRWAPDEGQLAQQRAVQTVRKIYDEAANQADPDKRQRLAKWAASSEARSKLSAMLELAESFCISQPSDFDTEDTDFLLNVNNGTVDLQSGDLLEHDRRRGITKLAPVDYDPAASAPRWHEFLDTITGGDEGLQKFLQKSVGYALTASTREQCVFILWGSGANGKSTFISTIMSLLDDYAVQTATSTLMAQHYDSIPNDVARLAGARFVSAVETGEYKKLNESLVKQMTGGDRISARFLRREWFDFTAQFKLFLATNHKPRIDGTDHAIWRRIRLIPFTVTIPDEQQDRDLPRKLLDESSGILNWAVKGCQMWLAEGLDAPNAVQEATATYRKEQDVLGEFIDECCVEHPDAMVKTSSLYECYQEWCQENGEKPIGRRYFGRMLGERGYEPARPQKQKGWRGIGLAADTPFDLSEPPAEGADSHHTESSSTSPVTSTSPPDVTSPKSPSEATKPRDPQTGGDVSDPKFPVNGEQISTGDNREISVTDVTGGNDDPEEDSIGSRELNGDVDSALTSPGDVDATEGADSDHDVQACPECGSEAAWQDSELRCPSCGVVDEVPF